MYGVHIKLTYCFVKNLLNGWFRLAKNVGGSAGIPTNFSSLIKITELAMTEINWHCLVCLYSMDAECICVDISEMWLVLE